MRYSRWLILAAIFSIVAFLVTTYSTRKRTLANNAPTAPDPLESGIEGRANNWCYTQSDGSRPRVKVCAEHADTKAALIELEGVELWLYRKGATEYDLVKSAKAQFDKAGKSLYSDGDVEITMGVPVDAPQRGRLLKIHTSGARFSSESGTATTDRAATFEFDQGGGSATGADYDPATRELHLHSQVALDWRGKSANVKPMHAEAGEAIYRERESKVILFPWSKLTRDTLRLDAGMSVVMLKDGEIQHAEMQAGRGVRDDPGRKVEFAADQLYLNFGEAMLVQQISGEHNTRLVSTSPTGRTTITSDHLDLGFLASGHESDLDTGTAVGKSIAESVPYPQPGALAAETRVLRSETIRLKMRAGGQEIASAETDSAGTLDFLPNRAGQSKRSLKGDRIWIEYGPENKIQSFRSTNVSTRTDKPPTKEQPAPPPALTESKEILATFDPATGELARVEQKTDFHYQEGLRQARGNQATLEQQKDLMTLEGGSRVWDPTGSVTADHIVMNQKSGDYTAEGHVASTRQPEKKGKSSAMLSTDEVTQAQAQKMVSTDRNQKIHYEGNAIAQQGANRVRADRLDIDNNGRVMEAHGNVVSEFVDKSKAPDAKAPAKSTAPIFTKVRAADLVYTEETRLAVYQGGTSLVKMERPGLIVESKELRAFLKDGEADSSLDKTLADGAVKIVSMETKAGPNKGRTRTGTGEHGEYYSDEGKVILQGDDALLVDSVKANTTGKQLTWWANNDRLLVNGSDSKPATSTIHKK